LEERRLSSPNGSSRGKTEASSTRKFLECEFLDNVEKMFFAISRQCRGNVFRSNQLASGSCKGPVEVVYGRLLPLEPYGTDYMVGLSE